MGAFHDVIWVVLVCNLGEAIFDGRKGASEESDCFHLSVCQVTEVQVAGCQIGLELLTPIEVGTRCDAGIDEPAPPFCVLNFAIRLPNLCSIVTLTDSDTWMAVFFALPSARVFAGWLEVRAMYHLFIDKKVRCERYMLQCESGPFCDYLRSLLSGARGVYMWQSVASFSAHSGNPLGLRIGAGKANGNIKIAHKYIGVVYLLSLL